MSDKKTKVVLTRFSEEDYERLQRLATARGTTLATEIRRIVNDYNDYIVIIDKKDRTKTD